MILLDDGLVLFFGLAPILSYALLRPAFQGHHHHQSQRQRQFLMLSMAVLAMVCMVKVLSGSSWVTMLDLFLEVLLRFLIITLVVAFLALSYVLLKVVTRQKTTASMTMPDDQPTRVKSISFHPTEPSWMIFALYSGHVVICKGGHGHDHDDHSNKMSYRYAVSPGCVVRACLFWGKDQFIAASDDNRIRVLNHCHHQDGRLLHEFQAHGDYIRSLDIIAGGEDDRSLLLSCSDDMTIKVWDMRDNYHCIKTFHGHMHYVMQVRCHPQETGKFATASLDRTIKFWSVDETIMDSSLYTLEGHEDGVNSIDFWPTTNNNNTNLPLLLSGSDDFTVRLWNYETRQALHIWRGHLDNVTAVKFLWNNHHDSSSSLGIVSTSEDCTLRFWQCSVNEEEEGEGRQAMKIIQYAALGRGWALATKRSATTAGDLEESNNQGIVAIGLDQTCLVLDVLHDETNGGITVSKETNITNDILLENAHVPVVIHSNHGVV